MAVICFFSSEKTEEEKIASRDKTLSSYFPVLYSHVYANAAMLLKQIVGCCCCRNH